MASEHAQRSNWKNELLPNIVDHLSRETPEALYAEYPKSSLTYDEGYRKITYGNLANAINGAAWWLLETWGPPNDHEVLTYIGPNDLRYVTLILAAVKVGYVLFLTSPRNSVAAHVKLFDRLKCTKLLSPEPKSAPVIAILESHSMQHAAVPSVTDLLEKRYPHYAYDRTFEASRSEPFMVIHTSGSTGFPKPLVYTHDTVARNMNMLAHEPLVGPKFIDKLWQGKRLLNCFPPFHGACLIIHLFSAIPFGTVPIAPLSGPIPTAQSVVDALRQTPADVAVLVPSIVTELSQDHVLLDFCSRNLERCLYAGGDLPQAIGDKVASKLPLVCQYGASEIGITPQLIPETMGRYDWKYISYHPCLGTEFREIAEGSYELYVKHDPEKENEQPTFTIFPDLKEYGTRDLYKPHPTKPDLWSWCARADDIIVFLNGEKTNPISMEQYIMSQNHEVLTAIVVGAQRFQAALLVEPTPNAVPRTTAEEAVFIEKIWPSVQEANKVAPAHARIEKGMILPMKPEKPVVRAGKGTIQRAATLQQYSAEIDSLYQNTDLHLDQSSSQFARSSDIQEEGPILRIVRLAIAQVLDGSEFGDDDDIFALGADSLQALRITRKLRQSFRLSDIAIATIYNNQTVARLSKAIYSLQVTKQASQTLDDQSRTSLIASVFEEYRDLVRKTPRSSSKADQLEKNVVVLTGSTGTLGTFLLAALLDDTAVDHIYCLNRRDTGRETQQSRFESAHLPVESLDSRVTFLKANLAEPRLGLRTQTYDSIRENATLIIHNAWPVNFNLSIESFRPQLAGLVNLFSLSTAARNMAHVFFVSSISSVLNLRNSSQLTLEETIGTTTAPLRNGYAESKFISEQLCDEASRHLHIPVSFARVGQIAGPVRRAGLWNPAEWIPSLVMSSIQMGLLPDSLGSSLSSISWMPVDLLAEVIADITIRQTKLVPGSDVAVESLPNGAQVFHLQNPRVTSWPALLPGIRSTLQELSKKSINVVPVGSWLAQVRRDLDHASGNGTEESVAALVKEHPAVKLLDFFVGSLSDNGQANNLDLTCSLAQSARLRTMEGVSNDWMHKWISEWLHARR
ncbi:MAG: putative NRPS-like protein biosynthetic cluster [Bathelium mastoideum]|nr:MAG: putative NRPS-like protein biosynthetic cluster [Bathelium mastoideum]